MERDAYMTFHQLETQIERYSQRQMTAGMKGINMVHQIILPVERSAIINKYLPEFAAATNPVECSILWKKVIHEFRTCTIIQTGDDRIIGGLIYWLTPKHSYRVTWYEIAKGTIVGFVKDKYVVRSKGHIRMIHPNQVVAIERKR